MKKKLIEIKTDKRTAEIILNKKAWKKLFTSIIIFILTLATIFAIILLPIMPMVWVVNWSISDASLIIFISCLAWLGLVAIYNIWITKEQKNK